MRLSQVLDRSASQLRSRQRDAEALGCLEQSLRLKRKALGDPTALRSQFRDMVLVANSTAMQRLAQGRVSEGVSMLRNAQRQIHCEELARARHGDGDSDSAAARAAIESGGAESRAEHEGGLETLHILTANNLACCQRHNQKPELALSTLQHALDRASRTPHSVPVAGCHLNLCAVLSSMGRHKEALPHAQAAVFHAQEEFISAQSADAVTAERRRQRPRDDASASAESDECAAVLASAYHNLAVELEFAHKRTAALPWFQKAADLARRWGARGGACAALRPQFEDTARRVMEREARRRRMGEGGNPAAIAPREREEKKAARQRNGRSHSRRQRQQQQQQPPPQHEPRQHQTPSRQQPPSPALPAQSSLDRTLCASTVTLSSATNIFWSEPAVTSGSTPSERRHRGGGSGAGADCSVVHRSGDSFAALPGEPQPLQPAGYPAGDIGEQAVAHQSTFAVEVEPLARPVPAHSADLMGAITRGATSPGGSDGPQDASSEWNNDTTTDGRREVQRGDDTDVQKRLARRRSQERAWGALPTPPRQRRRPQTASAIPGRAAQVDSGDAASEGGSPRDARRGSADAVAVLGDAVDTADQDTSGAKEKDSIGAEGRRTRPVSAPKGRAYWPGAAERVESHLDFSGDEKDRSELLSAAPSLSASSMVTRHVHCGGAAAPTTMTTQAGDVEMGLPERSGVASSHGSEPDVLAGAVLAIPRVSDVAGVPSQLSSEDVDGDGSGLFRPKSAPKGRVYWPDATDCVESQLDFSGDDDSVENIGGMSTPGGLSARCASDDDGHDVEDDATYSMNMDLAHGNSSSGARPPRPVSAPKKRAVWSKAPSIHQRAASRLAVAEEENDDGELRRECLAAVAADEEYECLTVASTVNDGIDAPHDSSSSSGGGGGGGSSSSSTANHNRCSDDHVGAHLHQVQQTHSSSSAVRAPRPNSAPKKRMQWGGGDGTSISFIDHDSFDLRQQLLQQAAEDLEAADFDRLTVVSAATEENGVPETLTPRDAPNYGAVGARSEALPDFAPPLPSGHGLERAVAVGSSDHHARFALPAGTSTASNCGVVILGGMAAGAVPEAEQTSDSIARAANPGVLPASAAASTGTATSTRQRVAKRLVKRGVARTRRRPATASDARETVPLHTKPKQQRRARSGSSSGAVAAPSILKPTDRESDDGTEGCGSDSSAGNKRGARPKDPRTKFETARGMPSREVPCSTTNASAPERTSEAHQQDASSAVLEKSVHDSTERLKRQIRTLRERSEQALAHATAKAETELQERKRAEALLEKTKRGAAARLDEALRQGRETSMKLDESRRESEALAAREAAKAARAERAILAAKRVTEEAAAEATEKRVAAAAEKLAKAEQAAQLSVSVMQEKLTEALRSNDQVSARLQADLRAAENAAVSAAASTAAQVTAEAAEALSRERVRLEQQHNAAKAQFEQELEQQGQMQRASLEERLAAECARGEAQLAAVREELDREKTLRLEVEERLQAKVDVDVQPLNAGDQDGVRGNDREDSEDSASDTAADRPTSVSAQVRTTMQPHGAQITELVATQEEIKAQCSSRQTEFAQECAATQLQAHARGFLVVKKQAKQAKQAKQEPPFPSLTRARSHARLQNLRVSVDDAGGGDPLPSLGTQVGLASIAPDAMPFATNEEAREAVARHDSSHASVAPDQGASYAAPAITNEEARFAVARDEPAKGSVASEQGAPDAAAALITGGNAHGSAAKLLSPVGNQTDEHSWFGKAHVQPSQTLTDRMNHTSRAIRETARFRRSGGAESQQHPATVCDAPDISDAKALGEKPAADFESMSTAGRIAVLQSQQEVHTELDVLWASAAQEQEWSSHEDSDEGGEAAKTAETEGAEPYRASKAAIAKAVEPPLADQRAARTPASRAKERNAAKIPSPPNGVPSLDVEKAAHWKQAKYAAAGEVQQLPQDTGYEKDTASSSNSDQAVSSADSQQRQKQWQRSKKRGSRHQPGHADVSGLIDELVSPKAPKSDLPAQRPAATDAAKQQQRRREHATERAIRYAQVESAICIQSIVRARSARNVFLAQLRARQLSMSRKLERASHEEAATCVQSAVRMRSAQRRLEARREHEFARARAIYAELSSGCSSGTGKQPTRQPASSSKLERGQVRKARERRSQRSSNSSEASCDMPSRGDGSYHRTLLARTSAVVPVSATKGPPPASEGRRGSSDSSETSSSTSIHTSGGSGSDFISSGSSTGTGSTATSAGGMSSAGIERRRKPLAVGQAHVVPLV